MTKDNLEYIRNWIFRADEDIDVMQNLIETGPKPFTSTICFHAQQAVEKYLKAFLAFHLVDFPRTHDLDFLLIECQKCDGEGFDIDLKSLTEFGVSVRYPDDFYIPEEKEAIEYFKIANKIKETVKRKIGQ